MTAEADHALAAHVRAALASLPQAVCHYTAEVTEQLLEDSDGITCAQVRVAGPTALHVRWPDVPADRTFRARLRRCFRATSMRKG